MYSALVCATSHPNNVFEYRGLFNRRSLAHMAKRGIDIDVVSPQPYAPPIGPYSEYRDIQKSIQYAEYILHCPRFLYLLPKSLFYGVSGKAMSLSLERYLNKNFSCPDIAHSCHIYPDGYAMRSYALEHDLPYTVVAHGGKLNSYESYSQSVQKKIDQVLEDATLVMCVSNALAERTESIVPETQAKVIPIGADVDRFNQYAKKDARAQIGVDPSSRLILYVGQFIERKGIDLLIDSLNQFDTKGKQYVLVGHRGNLNSDLEAAIEAQGLQNSIEVWYQVSNKTLTQLFAASDLLILPSRAEGRPTVIYEAMASKTAVLASELPGVREQVEDGKTGVLLPTPPGPEFVHRMNELTDEPERLRQMGEAGYERLLENDWTWDAHTNRVIDAHQEILKKH